MVEIFLVTFLGGFIWGIYNIVKTFHDRHWMNCKYWSIYNPDWNKAVTQRQYEELMAESRRVTMETHIWYRIAFRDWKQLYPIFFSTFKDEI